MLNCYLYVVGSHFYLQYCYTKRNRANISSKKNWRTSMIHLQKLKSVKRVSMKSIIFFLSGNWIWTFMLWSSLFLAWTFVIDIHPTINLCQNQSVSGMIDYLVIEELLTFSFFVTSPRNWIPWLFFSIIKIVIHLLYHCDLLVEDQNLKYVSEYREELNVSVEFDLTFFFL